MDNDVSPILATQGYPDAGQLMEMTVLALLYFYRECLKNILKTSL